MTPTTTQPNPTAELELTEQDGDKETRLSVEFNTDMAASPMAGFIAATLPEDE